MKLLDEFKTFIFRGNVIELAVAFVVGAAFTDLVKSAVAFLVSPILQIVLASKGGDWFLDFTYLKLGSFLMAVLDFAITAAIVFFLFVKPLNRLTAMFGKKEAEPVPPATLNDVVAELRELKEEMRRAKGGTTPPPPPIV